MPKLRVVIIIVIVLLAGTAFWYFRFRKEEKPLVLQTEQPHYGYISKSVTATGTVQPVDTVAVGSQVSGTIKNIYTDFNAKVRKGQLLAELDKSLFEAQTNQYRANLEVAKASLVYQKSTFDRQTLLYNAGAISKADFENSQNQYLGAKANVQSVQAQLDAAIKNLSYASIYSPVDGVVMTRNVSVGQTVAASFNTPTLFIIAKDITKMQVQAAVSEADIGDVRTGLRAAFTVDAYPDISFNGTVNQIRLEPVVSANVVTYSTLITAPNQDLKLKPGMTANIFIFTREVDSAMLISAKALKFKPDSSMTKQFRIIPDTNAERELAARSAPGFQRWPHCSSPPPARLGLDTDRLGAEHGHARLCMGQSGRQPDGKKVTTGLNNDTQVQILSGLDNDDEIVVAAEVETRAEAKSGAVRSPFMPARRGGGSRGGGGGGGRPGGGGR
ncbi:efflux RND transporter periplasmic adaptor subunit [Puia sp. P3]|uniref:efflux RND transporter periplasmic adaptor subunit n=1 Tax=Puia sp. P3 TaxID=3423952 RepID=UPI003D67DB12